jgi:hypothetical protein
MTLSQLLLDVAEIAGVVLGTVLLVRMAFVSWT